MEYDDNQEIDPYMPEEYKIKYQNQFPDSKGDKILFYLNGEEETFHAKRSYLNHFIRQARSKSPYRIDKGFNATYDTEEKEGIKDISDFKQDLGEIFCQTVSNKNGQFIRWLVEKTEINLNQPLKDGRVLLHTILDDEDVEINEFKWFVDLLVKYGADINQENQITGETLLYKALNQNNSEFIDFILKRGGVKSLVNAIENDREDVIADFLTMIEREELDLNSLRKEDCALLLIAAAENNNYYSQSLIKKLLSFGVNPNQENSSGETPLSVAVKNNYTELVEILLSFKEVKVNENLLDQSLDSKINKMLSEAFKNQQLDDHNFEEKFKETTQVEYEKSTKINTTLKNSQGNFGFKISPNLNLENSSISSQFKVKINKDPEIPKSITNKPSVKCVNVHENKIEK